MKNKIKVEETITVITEPDNSKMNQNLNIEELERISNLLRQDDYKELNILSNKIHIENKGKINYQI